MNVDCKRSPVYLQAPRRRSDGAAVVDTERYQVKLYTTPGGEKLIKRRGGTVEKQYRLNIGRLPVAYRHAVPSLANHHWDMVRHTLSVAVPVSLGGLSIMCMCSVCMLKSNETVCVHCLQALLLN